MPGQVKVLLEMRYSELSDDACDAHLPAFGLLALLLLLT